MSNTLQFRLVTLANKARHRQWHLDIDIDWTLPVRPNRWIPKHVVAATVSQLYHGEIASAEMCRYLLDQLDGTETKAFLALQIADEERHAAAYQRYLGLFGDRVPIETALQRTLQAGYEAPGGNAGKLVACHLLLESEALRVHEALAARVRCPLLDAINRRIGPDEARHVAFGSLMARDLVRDMEPATRRQLSDWAAQTWHDCARALLDDLRNYGLLATQPFSQRLEKGWARQARQLEDIGLPV